MKKHLYIIIIAALLVGLPSCEGNLEPEVYNRLSPGNYPETEEDYLTLVNNIYGQFRYNNAWYRYSCDPQSRLILGEIGTDERPQSTFDFNPGYALFHNFYTRMVPSVTKATYTLALIEESDLEEQMKNRLMSEVICCRAQWLYDLGSFYGPPPVVLDKEKAKNPKELYFPPRLSEEDYLAFVEADITYAMKHLPVKYESGADYGRYTKGAAASILMKMYMQHKRFEDAVKISDSILTYGYGLVSEYSKIWDISNEKNEECIFVLTAPSKEHVNANIYRAHVLPSDWVSLTGAKVVAYDGYR
ncbi:MAG: RagB/SusD family nutrient uptake outer membrane protein, partial [Bacteroidales bacterium]|nr:RagB/SusD family nutrient uptake outer membrane protein [Bacteroidales bacterium]